MTEPHAHIAPVQPENVYHEVCRAIALCQKFDLAAEAIRLSDAKLQALNDDLDATWGPVSSGLRVKPGGFFMGLLVGLWDRPGLAVGPIEALGGKKLGAPFTPLS